MAILVVCDYDNCEVTIRGNPQIPYPDQFQYTGIDGSRLTFCGWLHLAAFCIQQENMNLGQGKYEIPMWLQRGRNEAKTQFHCDHNCR